MEFKQKLAYMSVGGLLMLSGMVLVTLFGASDLVAQSNGSFDTIYCRKIVVSESRSPYRMEIENNTLYIANPRDWKHDRSFWLGVPEYNTDGSSDIYAHADGVGLRLQKKGGGDNYIGWYKGRWRE